MAARRARITIRRAEVADAEGLCATFGAPRAMAGTLQLPFPSVETWRKRIADRSGGDDYLLVAVASGEIVGNVGLHAASRSGRRKHAAGIGIAVRDDWQRRGVGSALLAAAIDIADNWLAYRRLELTVYTDNAAAMALYRKFGFVPEGTHRDYALRDGRFVDALAMARLRPETTGAPKAPAAAKEPAKRMSARRKRPPA